MWLSLYRGLNAKVNHPIQFSQTYLTRRLDLSVESTADAEALVKDAELALKVKERHCCSKSLVRAGAILSITWCVFLLYNETMLIFSNSGSVIGAVDSKARTRIWIIFIGAVLIMSGTVFSAFLTIFKLKFSDYLQLVPKLTDPVAFCSFTSLFSKVIAVTCFNFMVMAGEVRLRIESTKSDVSSELEEELAFQTSFIKFYSSMIETPFLGDQYNYLLPGAMLLFSICFLLLNYFKYESSFVSTLRRYNNHQDSIQESSSDSTDPTFESTRNALLNSGSTKTDAKSETKAAKKQAA